MDVQIDIIVKASYQILKIGVKHDLFWSKLFATPFHHFFSGFHSDILIRYVELGSMFIIGNIFYMTMIEDFFNNKYETVEITHVSTVTSETILVPTENHQKPKDFKSSLALIPVQPVMKNKATCVDPKDLIKVVLEPKKQFIDGKKVDGKATYVDPKDLSKVVLEPKKQFIDGKKVDGKSTFSKGKPQPDTEEIIDLSNSIPLKKKSISNDEYRKMMSVMQKMITSGETMSCELMANSR
jgi:hypothetical protein